MNSLVSRPAFAGHASFADTDAAADRYAALMSVLRDRATARVFDRGYVMPRGHIEAVLDAASLAPSGANTQPWHYVVVTNPRSKRLIADAMTSEHEKRDRATGRLHRVDYAAMGHAPGFIAVLVDPRMTWAFPGLMDGSELDQRYHAHGETILLQSVAASTMAAHLAATALGYQVWWVSALGREEARQVTASLLGIPSDLRLTDFMLFGPSLLPPERRWKKDRAQISSWDRFDMSAFRSVEQIDGWMADMRQDIPALPGKG